MIEAHVYEMRPGHFTVHVVRVQGGRKRLLCANQGHDKHRAIEDALDAAGVQQDALIDHGRKQGVTA